MEESPPFTYQGFDDAAHGIAESRIARDASSAFVKNQSREWPRRLARVGVAAITVATVAGIGVLFPPSLVLTAPLATKALVAGIVTTEALVGGAALVTMLQPPGRRDKPPKSINKAQAPAAK